MRSTRDPVRDEAEREESTEGEGQTACEHDDGRRSHAPHYAV